MLAGAILGPNASYDSAIDSLPDECYCELASSPSLSFGRSPSLSFSQQRHQDDKHSGGHMALSSLPPASASYTFAGAQPYQYKASSSPSTSISPYSSQMNGPILSNSSKNNSFKQNPSPHYRSLADYHHRLYNPGHTTRLSVSPSSDTVHKSASASATVNKSKSRNLDTQFQPTSMAIISDHSSGCVRSNYQRTSSGLTSKSNHLPDSCPGIHLRGTSAMHTAAAHSSRRVATFTDSHRNNNNKSGRITGSEEQQKTSAASNTEGTFGHHVHLEPACESLPRADRQQVLPVYSPTVADATNKSTSSTRNRGSTETATLSASSASLLRSSRSFTASYRQKANVTRKCFCFRFISLCP